jgi:hypothetical protein
MIVVVARAARMGKPVGESMLRKSTVAQVPFAGKTACPAVFGQDIGVTDLIIEERFSIGTEIGASGNEIVWGSNLRLTFLVFIDKSTEDLTLTFKQ